MLKSVLVKIAKKSIEGGFRDVELNKRLYYEKHPYLKEQKATFVTIKKDDKLRGSIGSVATTDTLLDNLIYNAYNSAFNDLRFDSISEEEIEDIDIEVFVLTKPREIGYESLNDLKTIIKPNRSGAVVKKGSKMGVLFPQAWSEISSFDEFILTLCAKANISKDIIEEKPNIFVFEIENI